jgi:hypothetical protein
MPWTVDIIKLLRRNPQHLPFLGSALQKKWHSRSRSLEDVRDTIQKSQWRDQDSDTSTLIDNVSDVFGDTVAAVSIAWFRIGDAPRLHPNDIYDGDG